jgi:hypothetical protein
LRAYLIIFANWPFQDEKYRPEQKSIASGVSGERSSILPIIAIRKKEDVHRRIPGVVFRSVELEARVPVWSMVSWKGCSRRWHFSDAHASREKIN